MMSRPSTNGNERSSPSTRTDSAGHIHSTDKAHLGAVQSKAKAKADPEIIYPQGVKLALVMMSIFTSMFLVSLDRLIISTAIPQITNEFNSAGDIGWYGTAFLLTNCAFQLVFGKIYKIFSVKATFLTSILLFEIGSALCGAAPNSVAFILGRAISGLGAGGISSGVVVIIVYAVPLHKQPKYQGFFGAVFAIASVAGPLVSGAFTTNITWRWCFYINLPLGGTVILLIFILLHVPDRHKADMSFKEKLRQLNALGMLFLLPGVICLCLALQWGGSTYARGRVVALLVLSIVLLIAFALIQIWKPDQATLPPHIVAQRSIASAFLVSCCFGAHLNLFVYYLPIWFQAIDRVSAVASGIRLLPTLISMAVASILTGQVVSRIGYYAPALLFGTCLLSIGAGLLTTLEVGTATRMWIGYQILYGFGAGATVQAPNMAAQTVLPRENVSIGISLMFFGQQLFGAVFTSVGQNVLVNQLADRLVGVPGINAKLIVSTGATNLLKLIPAEYYTKTLEAYNDSLRVCFQVGLIMACISILSASGMEWLTVKKKLPPKNPDVEQDAKGGRENTEQKAEQNTEQETEKGGSAKER